MTAKQKRNYFFIYSALCIVVLAAAYYPFAGRTLIRNGDALHQHCRALVYYSEWLRGIFRTLVREHRLVIPEWNFSIGYGANILTTFNYYAIGDPLNLFSVFVPSDYMPQFYSLLILVRHYLAGLAFSYFCIYMNKKNTAAILAGALTYAFCGHALFSGALHAFFVNPMIYFPFVLVGIEKIIRRDKPYVLILAVFVSAISSFYYFYMIVLETVIYVLVRGCCIYGWKRKKEMCGMIFRIAVYSVMGLLLSACIFLPVVGAFMKDYRAEKEYAVNLFYDLRYYEMLPSAFVTSLSGGYSTVLGYGVPALLAVILLFFGEKRKQRRLELKILFLLGGAMIAFPLAGQMMNGFSYVSNRWIWGFSFLVAFILCDAWEELVSGSKRDTLLLLLMLLLYSVLITGAVVAMQRFQGGIPKEIIHALLHLAAAAAGLLICFLLQNKSPVGYFAVESFIIFLVMAGMVQNSYDQYGGKEQEAYLTASEVNEHYQKKSEKIVHGLQEQEKGFFRYTGNAITDNAALNHGTHSMNFFWSLSNGNIADFLIQTEAYVFRLYHYTGLDERTGLTALASNRYYVCKEKSARTIPYGYKKLREEDGYVIYENEQALPLGYTYDSYITREQADVLNGAQKEEAMLQSIILEEPAEECENGQPKTSGARLDYRILSADEGIEIKDGKFKVTKEDASITLEVASGEQKGENYLCFSGFKYEGESLKCNTVICAATADGKEKKHKMYYETAKSKWPSGVSEYTVNLGYSREALKTVTITFDVKGNYCFDELYLWHQPMDEYRERIAALKETVLEEEQIGTDTVSGKVTLDSAKLLCLTIPYDGGWTAYVDGEKQPLLKANYMFSALELPKGQHSIVLRYRTPGLYAGALVSAAGIFILLGVVFLEKRRGTVR